jgi:hypothetical protein
MLICFSSCREEISLTSASQIDSGSVEFNSTYKDFGEFKLGSGENRRQLLIVNSMEKDVTVRAIRVSCGCLTVKHYTRALPLDSVTPLSLVLDCNKVGVRESSLQLYTADELYPLHCDITWEVVSPIEPAVDKWDAGVLERVSKW